MTDKERMIILTEVRKQERLMKRFEEQFGEESQTTKLQLARWAALRRLALELGISC